MTTLLTKSVGGLTRDTLTRIVAFYKPKTFTNTSTQFDMGYEQCKRDLRHLIRQLVPDTADIEMYEAKASEPVEVHQKGSTWRLLKRG